MSLLNILDASLWPFVIEFLGALVITGYVIYALFILIRNHDLPHARITVAEGAVTGLSFKLAATLLKTIELQSWQQILMFTAIFALRTLLKRLFMWESSQIRRNNSRL